MKLKVGIPSEIKRSLLIYGIKYADFKALSTDKLIKIESIIKRDGE